MVTATRSEAAPSTEPQPPSGVGRGSADRASGERPRGDEPEHRAEPDDDEHGQLADRRDAELHEDEREANAEQQAAHEPPDWMPPNHDALPSTVVVPPACGRELQMSAAPARAISTATQNGRVATGLPVSWNQPLPSQRAPPSPSMAPDT